MTDARLAPDPWGVHGWWYDMSADLAQVADETVERVRTVIGSPPGDLDQRAPVVVRPGGRLDTGPVEVTLETGETVDVDDVLPDDFPVGYHWITTPSGLRRRLIVSPGRCWLPPGRAWGWSVQLYAARSSRSWGIGDLADLREIRLWAQSQGAGFLLVNPLHAVAPTLPQWTSPYLPATRRFLNPIYLHVPAAPGADLVDLAEPIARARELNDSELVDRDAVWRLKDAVLRRVFEVGARLDDFAQWRDEQGEPLEQYGVWCALSLEHGPDWRTWPDALHDPRSDAVAAYADRRADEVSYHVWLQWLLRDQLQHATGELMVIQDLPIGVAGGGVDGWAWQDVLADGVTVGAPPDLFQAGGQDWGSPPFVPWRLRADGYEAFIQTVRGTISGAGGLRIDHVMGLFRLWWVPRGSVPTAGAYVRYPSQDLLDIVALESHRAGAAVVGEDLGVVEAGVREVLAEHGILTYRLLWFERDDPADWPENAMAAVTTHDLPTVPGLWTREDLEDQVRYNDITREEARQAAEPLRTNLRRDGLPDDADPDEAVLAAHRLLARSPCRLLAATLEDAVGQARRPNLPGTTARPNWSVPLPVLVDDLPTHRGAAAVAAVLCEVVSD
jgi:4-alpha-glucanotransferase